MLSLFIMNISHEWMIEIDFSNNKNPNEILTLKWNLIDHLPSYYWLKSFRAMLNSSWPYYGRFTGFIDGYKNRDYLTQALNDAIDDINRCGKYYIKERAQKKFNQEFANIIHHHFEVLYGSITKQSSLFLESSAFIQNAIVRLNHAIHDMEAYHREQGLTARERNNSFSGLISEIPGSPRLKLPFEFYDSFTLDTDFGDMVAHYSLVGKTWWEVFLDQDDEIFQEAIRPLNVLTGEFDVFFGAHKLTDEQRNAFNSFLVKRGVDPADKKLGLGYLPLAKLQREDKVSNLDYKKKLAKFMKVNSIRLIQSGKIQAERDFSESRTSADGFFVRSEEQVISCWEDLKLVNTPIQLVPIRAELLGTTEFAITSLDGHPRVPHTLCLVGTSDEYRIKLIQNEYLYLDGMESISIAKGMCLDLNFSPLHCKFVLKRTTILSGY